MTSSYSQSPKPGDIELAVAIGRIEEMLKSMNDKLDKLEAANDTHADVLRKHEVAIRLLEERQGPKVHWSSWAIAICASVSLLASFILWVTK